MIEKGGFEIENDYAGRLVAPQVTKDENEDFEVSLRPKTLDEYIGQEKVKDNLKIYIQAAKKRGDSLDHVLLYGPPGLGKTTLSTIIAHEMGIGTCYRKAGRPCGTADKSGKGRCAVY